MSIKSAILTKESLEDFFETLENQPFVCSKGLYDSIYKSSDLNRLVLEEYSESLDRKFIPNIGKNAIDFIKKD